jgi:hypothetical protein
MRPSRERCVLSAAATSCDGFNLFVLIGYLPETNLESAALLQFEELQAPSAQLARAGMILSTSFY